MSYFRELPDLGYQNFLSNSPSSQSYLKVKNLFRRNKLRDDLQNIFTVFDKYEIMEGARPDTVAEDYFGSSDLDWVVLITAGIVNGLTTGGPIVRLGTNWLSITSTWIQWAPPLLHICSAACKLEKSADKIDGANLKFGDIFKARTYENDKSIKLRIRIYKLYYFIQVIMEATAYRTCVSCSFQFNLIFI